MSLSFGSALAWVQTELGGAERAADDAAAADAVRRAKAALESAVQEADAARERAEAAERKTSDARRQAIFDTLYFVAAADGAISTAERRKLSIGLMGILGDGFDADAVDDGLDMARVLVEQHGKGAPKEIAAVITDGTERMSLVLIASAIAWLGGGVGTKEGLALQGLAAAFDLPMKTLHELMASGALAAKG